MKKLLSIFTALLLGLVLLVSCKAQEPTQAPKQKTTTEAAPVTTTAPAPVLPETDESGKVLYTVTASAELDSSKVYFAWLWGEGIDGHSVLLTQADSTHLYCYDAEGNANIIVVTFAAATTEFSWDNKEAQSDDLALTDRAASWTNGEAQPPASQTTYTISFSDVEIPEGRKVFLWLWGGDCGGGVAAEAQVSEGTLTAQAAAGATGCVVVLLKADATEFSWDSKDQQSNDVTLADNAGSFNAWK